MIPVLPQNVTAPTYHICVPSVLETAEAAGTMGYLERRRRHDRTGQRPPRETSMRVLGIHDGHSSSVCLLEDGLVRCIRQEERFTRQKNQGGFPESALLSIIDEYHLRKVGVDLIAFSTKKFRTDFMRSRNEVMAVYRSMFDGSLDGHGPSATDAGTEMRQGSRRAVLAELGLAHIPVQFVDHHQCHAATAYFGFEAPAPTIILTCDGQGDGTSATVWRGEGGSLDELARVGRDDSVGAIFSYVTFLLGFVPLEHEYKLMGMAPYAVGAPASRDIADLLHSYFEFDQTSALTWRRTPGTPVSELLPRQLEQSFRFRRFDNISAGCQIFLEEFLTRWVQRVVSATGIDVLRAAGGTFMNVKANQRIAELPCVSSFAVFPSCGDESNSLGAAYIGSINAGSRQVQPLRSIYSGPSYAADRIEEAVYRRIKGNDVTAKVYPNIDDKVAELLAEGEIVARFAGRSEFGARALGNRSILADPSSPTAVMRINQMIKMRDFWMPFAPSIMAEHASSLLNVKRPPHSPYMMMSYGVRESARNVLRAAIHPMDGSVRPQIVSAHHNPEYHALIEDFRTRTNIPAVLNTSFNIHGEPIVETPDDAVDVFWRSGLTHLAIGNYLLSKTSGRR
ncbi:MAG: carbamoyltransferase [Mycobacterium sp.]|nr:carbamoyltransferase [Mycobacterium sp.]